MLAWKKRISRLEEQINAAVEKFIFCHRILGVLVLFLGMPMITLAAVCACTTLIVLPFWAMGWLY